MGFYYESEEPPKEKPPGCMDVWLITRAVYAVLFWPMLALFAVVADAMITLLLFTSGRPYLALIPIAFTAVGVWAFARWEQHHFRPPE